MSARDELADEISGHPIDSGYYSTSIGIHDAREIADDILEAGWRLPARIITTAEELDALAFETVIRDAEGHVLERWGHQPENVWVTMMVSAFIPRGDVALPATVLHEGEATS